MKKVKLTYDKCIGCALCYYLNKNIFTIDENGFCKIKQENINNKEEKDLKKIVELCPTKALKIVK